LFAWLERELATIQTRKFHLVDGPASAELAAAIRNSGVPVPPSYLEFVLRFGNAKLYRLGGNYIVQVYASLTECSSPDHGALLQFGRTDLSQAYFQEALLREGKESPVFEWRHERGVALAAESFDAWLSARCRSARRLFSAQEWADVLTGPPPFTAHELAIVDARRKFQWRVAGIAENGDLQFDIYNGSTMTLPFLSLGVRGKLRPPKSGLLNGGVWLPVSMIQPGQSMIVEKDCYKDVVDPLDIEVFAEPDPEPEDRDRYWEFR